MTENDEEPDRLQSSIPFLALPVLLIAFVIRYPISLVVIVLVFLIGTLLSPPSGTTPTQQAPQAPAAVQTPTISPPPSAVSPASSESRARYTIQVGAFESKARADTLSNELAGLYSDVSAEPASGTMTLYRVYVGRFADESSAQAVVVRLRSNGLSPLIVPLDDRGTPRLADGK